MTYRAVLIFCLAVSARAQAPAPAAAHPALFRPANDQMVREALRSDLHDLGRAWHLEARTRIARRPSRRCRQCDHPVIRRNADLCGPCATRWESAGARPWDF